VERAGEENGKEEDGVKTEESVKEQID